MKIDPNMSAEDSAINSAIHIAFLAGRWRGQVDLEESMDSNFFDAFMMFNHAQKTGGQCMHTVSLDSPDSRPVKYNLRSDKWREGVKKETKKWLDEAREILNQLKS